MAAASAGACSGSNDFWQLGTESTLGGLLVDEDGYQEAPHSPIRAELLPEHKLQTTWMPCGRDGLAFPRTDIPQ